MKGNHPPPRAVIVDDEVVYAANHRVGHNGFFYELHDAIDNIERDLKRDLNCIAVVHMDPIDLRDEATAAAREAVAEMVRGIDERISIHDFRMVPGKTHTNYIFDAVLPMDMAISDEEAEKMIETAVSEHFPECYGVVNVDRSYT